MTTYNGRTQVEAGFYLNRKTLHLTTVEKAGELHEFIIVEIK